MPWPAMSGALPCDASNSAWCSPMLADPSNPSEPTSPPARSLMMSPQQFGATSTSYASGLNVNTARHRGAVSTDVMSAPEKVEVEEEDEWGGATPGVA